MDTLYSSLGQFYFTTHSNAPPTFLQVVGWTKGAENPAAKRQYVYVRKVPLNISHRVNGGKWEFDNDIVKKYAAEIKVPVHKNVPHLVNGNAIIIEGAHFLRYQSITVPQYNFDFVSIQPVVPEIDIEQDLIDDLLSEQSDIEPIQHSRLWK